MRPRALDIGTGHGGFAIGFRDSGYEVTGIDILPKPRTYPEGVFYSQIDMRDYHPVPGEWNVVVGAVPCQPFSTSNTTGHRDPGHGLGLVREFDRIRREAAPKHWAMENVRGSRRYITPLLGEPKIIRGTWTIWGDFPPFLLQDSKFYKGRKGAPYTRLIPSIGKMKTSYRNRKAKGDLSAVIPYPIARGIAEACLP